MTSDPKSFTFTPAVDEFEEIARWPARADLFARKCDVDRAEAALIAFAGLKREAAQ